MWWCGQYNQEFDNFLKMSKKITSNTLNLLPLIWRKKGLERVWMQEDFIMKLLGIKEKYVELWEMKEENGEFHFWLQTKQRKQTCPKCGAKTKRVHSYRMQLIKGRLIEDRPVKIHLRKRRYLCPSCQKTFYEKLGFVKRYQRHTTSLEQQVLTYVGEHSFKAAGKMAGVSTNQVLRLFNNRQINVNRVLPAVIAIDE